MNNLMIKACLKILNQIMSRPICQLFLTNENGQIKFLKNSTIKIQSLEMIKEKLLNNEFSSFDEFFKSLKAFFDILESICQDDMIKICIISLKQSAVKQCEKIIESHQKWETQFYDEYDNIVRSLLTADSLFHELKYRIEAEKPIFLPFNSDEIQTLSSAIAKIDNSDIMDGIITIIKALEPNQKKSTSGEFVCDLTNCSPQTLQTISNYIRRQFELTGTKYSDNE